MKEEDLIKKLEKIELPEIEIKGHREWLKMKLIDWKYFREKRVFGFFPIFKKAGIFLGASISVLLIIFIASNLLTPQNNLAKAQKIALKDPQVKALIEKGAEIKDAEIVNGRAYLLITPKKPVEKPVEELSLETGEIRKLEELTALTEINLKEKKVSKIESIERKFPLSEEEREKIKKIAKIKENQILEIESLPSLELNLIKEGNEVKLEPREKRALIIYKIDKAKWLKRINITNGKIEETKFLGIEE